MAPLLRCGAAVALAAVVIAAVCLQTSRRKRDTQRRLRALFDTVPDAVLFFDDSGRYLQANPGASELFGVPMAQIVGRHHGDFSLPEHVPKLEEILAPAPSFRTGTCRVRRSDGTIRETEYRALANVLPGVHCLIVQDVTEQKAAEARVRDLSGRLLHLQDEERRRIARELHDTTGQSLAAIGLYLARLARSPIKDDAASKEALDESIRLTNEAIAEIRTLSYLLHPPLMDEAGLLPSLRWYARGFEERSGIAVRLDAPEELETLPRDVATAAFRIIQEALTNVQRHSGSRDAVIRIQRCDGSLVVAVEDHGAGMPEALRHDRGALRSAGVGVAGMEQRVKELGGTLDIASSSKGTTVRFDFPIQKA